MWAVLLLILRILVPVAWAEESVVSRAVADYQYTIDQFRARYDEFLLARSQFEKVDTFANQETLVDKARTMLVWRDKVWWTYFQAVRTDMAMSEGFDEGVKGEVMGELQDEQDALQADEDGVSTLTTRQTLLAKATEINDKADDYNRLAYQALLHIRVARLRYAIGELQAFRAKIVEAVAVQIRDEQTRQERQRGLDDTNETLTQAQQTLDEANQKAFGESRRWEYDSVSMYNEQITALVPVYDQVKKAMGLVGELSQGLVL